MRVLCVIDHFGSGGAQRQMVSLAIGLRRKGHDVTCFCYYPQYDFFRSELDGEGVPVHVEAKRSRIGFNVIVAIRKFLRDRKVDAVVAFMETPSIYAEIAAIGLPVRVVASERIDPPGARLTAFLFIRSLLHRAADCVVANSATSREMWVQLVPGLRKRFRVIRNGVDLQYFASLPMSELSHGFRLVAVGTVGSRKNVHGLVEALVDMKSRYGRIPFVTWVGKLEAGAAGVAYKEGIDHRLSEAGIGDYWRWAGEQRDVRPFLADAHALVHPSFREGLSNAVCEAFACGRPVLASGVGDNIWLIGNGEQGYLFDPDSPGSIADTIHRFMGLNWTSVCEMGRAARVFAERELSTDAYVGKFEGVIRKGCESIHDGADF